MSSSTEHMIHVGQRPSGSYRPGSRRLVTMNGKHVRAVCLQHHYTLDLSYWFLPKMHRWKVEGRLCAVCLRVARKYVFE